MNSICPKHYEHMYLLCGQCQQEAGTSSEHVQKMIDAADRREREELVLKFHLALLASEYDPGPDMTFVQVAAIQADAYLKWRDEERRQ